MGKIFTFSAEWPLDQAAKDWLANAYFPAKREIAIREIREIRARDGHAFDPDRVGPQVASNEVKVFLRADNWTMPDGSGAAGTFYNTGVSGNSAIPEIHVNWTREVDPTNNLYGRIVVHELIHYLLWLQYPPVDGDFVRYDNEWQNSQHGKLAPDKDIFLLDINSRIREYYPLNHASSPGLLPVK